MLRHLSVRLKSLFHRERLEQELDTELQYHLDMLIEQNLKAGMSTLEARRAALRVFGPVAGVKDDVRDTWMSRFVETAAQDIRYGVRNLGRNPGFALIVLLTPAQMMKIAAGNTLLCRFRMDDDMVWGLLTNHGKSAANDATSRLHASILLAGRHQEAA